MNLLDIEDLTTHHIEEIFNLADRVRAGQQQHLLKDRTFLLFFPETSLRTRVTFERGIQDLGGRSILFPPQALDRKESLEDIIRYMENWADGAIVRHADFSKVKELAAHASIPIINAMTAYNHPCEILSDLYAISKLRKDYRDLVYTFVGPRGNIARTWMQAAKVMNLKFHHVCTEGNKLEQETPNYIFHTDLESVLADSDVVLTDSLPSGYVTEPYIRSYQMTLDRMKLAKEGAMINPCPPFYRHEEVSEDVISSSYFVGYEFKKTLVDVQQAIILFCLAEH
ncbi:ornithine carbamoyltransferase [Paenibacillus sp. UNCCL117]|uniref:ornithine carbamoyltransferase n=1 Tax=unclassified Paenibacillus TaxID=185978 RepID=UPI0008901FFC|nr:MULTISPECIES: ornithine carbamoyltransferase [unclassified Paenibacillus]SDD16656.1 ornithine carbamoyltransferase [Paenibacillus sp. cl123]SFW34779.1 ornithine carbamoyltransferase [Paenibacillus sp. UNCCL117]